MLLVLTIRCFKAFPSHQWVTSSFQQPFPWQLSQWGSSSLPGSCCQCQRPFQTPGAADPLWADGHDGGSRDSAGLHQPGGIPWPGGWAAAHHQGSHRQKTGECTATETKGYHQTLFGENLQIYGRTWNICSKVRFRFLFIIYFHISCC